MIVRRITNEILTVKGCQKALVKNKYRHFKQQICSRHELKGRKKWRKKGGKWPNMMEKTPTKYLRIQREGKEWKNETRRNETGDEFFFSLTWGLLQHSCNLRPLHKFSKLIWEVVICLLVFVPGKRCLDCEHNPSKKNPLRAFKN